MSLLVAFKQIFEKPQFRLRREIATKVNKAGGVIEDCNLFLVVVAPVQTNCPSSLVCQQH